MMKNLFQTQKEAKKEKEIKIKTKIKINIKKRDSFLWEDLVVEVKLIKI